MKKVEMIQFLKDNLGAVKNSSLLDQIKYTLDAWKKDQKSVGYSDLRPLCREVRSFLEEEPQPQPQNSVKKPLKKDPSNEKQTDKKPVKAKSTATKDLAVSFEDTIQVENIGTLEKAQDITNFKELEDALGNGERILIGVYWSERLLKQFDYAPQIPTIKKPDKFANDLDILQVIFVEEGSPLCVCLSTMTYAPYHFVEGDFKIITDYNFRISNGMEFELYRVIEEDDSEEEEE